MVLIINFIATHVIHDDIRIVILLPHHLVGVAAQPVRTQRRRVSKPLVAPLAREGFVPCVRVHVHLQIRVPILFNRDVNWFIRVPYLNRK